MRITTRPAWSSTACSTGGPQSSCGPTGTADVIRALGLAKASGLPFAIRSGGHSVAGFSSTEGGIVLDLRA